MESAASNLSSTDFNRILELSVSPLKDWSRSEILTTINQQFKTADDFLNNKKNDWVKYTQIYLNLYRKDSSPDSIGAKILFTKFHETYANFTADEKAVEFEHRALSDQETVANLNAVAEFDWDEFDGSTVWNEWEWDKLFYGYGILDASYFDKKRQVLKPTVQNPYLFFFDPLATSMRTARYCGRYIYCSYYDLINDSRLDEDEVRKMAHGQTNFTGPNQSVNKSAQAYRDAKNILLNGTNYTEPVSPAGYFEIIEWYVKNAGKSYVVWTDNAFKFLLGWEELEYDDGHSIQGDDKTSEFPFILKQYHKSPRVIIGSSVPDIVEDDHRAMVKLVNYMFQGVKLDSIPTFLYNYKAFVNPKDLYAREVNKNIPLSEPVNGNVMPFPKTNVVSQDTLAFLNLLENRADNALGSSKILRGSLSQVKKSATEVAVAKAKQDLLLAARAKETMPAEKEFWYVWLARYRKNLKNSAKLIRLVGKNGIKEIKQLKASDFLPSIDPDIKVVSKLASEPQRVMARRDLAELIQPTVQAGGNLREMLKKIYYQYESFRKEDITNILPPTPHELRADQENEQLNNGELPLIHENDDDVTHIAVHMKADQTQKVTEAHLKAHYMNYLRKASIQGDGQGDAKNPELGKQMPDQVTKEQQNTASTSILGGQQNQLTPSDVK